MDFDYLAIIFTQLVLERQRVASKDILEVACSTSSKPSRSGYIDGSVPKPFKSDERRGPGMLSKGNLTK